MRTGCVAAFRCLPTRLPVPACLPTAQFLASLAACLFLRATYTAPPRVAAGRRCWHSTILPLAPLYHSTSILHAFPFPYLPAAADAGIADHCGPLRQTWRMKDYSMRKTRFPAGRWHCTENASRLLPPAAEDATSLPLPISLLFGSAAAACFTYPLRFCWILAGAWADKRRAAGRTGRAVEGTVTWAVLLSFLTLRAALYAAPVPVPAVRVRHASLLPAYPATCLSRRRLALLLKRFGLHLSCATSAACAWCRWTASASYLSEHFPTLFGLGSSQHAARPACAYFCATGWTTLPVTPLLPSAALRLACG